VKQRFRALTALGKLLRRSSACTGSQGVLLQIKTPATHLPLRVCSRSSAPGRGDESAPHVRRGVYLSTQSAHLTNTRNTAYAAAAGPQDARGSLEARAAWSIQTCTLLANQEAAMAAKLAVVVALAALACCASAQQDEPHPLSAIQPGRLLTQIEAAITLNVTYSNGTLATTYISGQQLVINLSGAKRSPGKQARYHCFATRGFTHTVRAGPHLFIFYIQLLCAHRRDSGLHQRLPDKPVYCGIRPVQHRRGCCTASGMLCAHGMVRWRVTESAAAAQTTRPTRPWSCIS